MADFRLAARRFIVAAGIIGAIAAAPAVAAFSGASPVSRTVADTPTCASDQDGDSLNCAPSAPPAAGAPNLENTPGPEWQEHSGTHH